MTAGRPPSRPLRVLLVEDEEANRALVRAILARSTEPAVRGLALSEAPSLQAARQVLSGQAVDLVLLDVRLPDGTGLDLARELAARTTTGRPQVIVMSASVLPGERQAALDAGCDAFLGKPFRNSELLGVISALAGAIARRTEEPGA